LQAAEVLGKLKNVAFVEFSGEDVVRHPLVREIVAAYDKYDKKRAKENK